MTPEQKQHELAAIRERRAKATSGEWSLRKSGDGKAIWIDNPGDGWHRLSVEVDSDDCDSDTAMANALFIVNAPTDIDTLLALLADAERERDHELAEHRTGAAYYEEQLELLRNGLAAATERSEQAADARQAEIVAFLRKEIALATRQAAEFTGVMKLDVEATIEGVQTITDAIERGEWKAND